MRSPRAIQQSDKPGMLLCSYLGAQWALVPQCGRGGKGTMIHDQQRHIRTREKEATLNLNIIF